MTGWGEQPGHPVPPWMYPSLSDTTVLDRAAGHMGRLVKEAVASPGEDEEYEHINGFTLSWPCCLVSNMVPVIQQDQTECVRLASGCELHIQAGTYMMWTDIQLRSLSK